MDYRSGKVVEVVSYVGEAPELRPNAPEASHPRSLVCMLSRKLFNSDVDSSAIGALRRPYIKYKNNRIPHRVMLIARRRSKVFDDLGLYTQYMVRHLSILDTGARPNFIMESLLPPEVRAHFRHGPFVNVADANKDPSPAAGIVILVV